MISLVNGLQSRAVDFITKKLGYKILAIGLIVLPQQLSHDVRVVNIEVPVRVFDGDSFVPDLAIDDFEVYEDGVPQELQAVYLIKNAAVERKEEKTAFTPKTERNFFLFFQVYTYNPKLEEAIDYFVRNVLRPEDSLTVVTSLKQYRLKKEWIAKSSKDEMARQLTKLVRHDTLVGNTEYLSILNELKRMMAGGRLDSTGAVSPDLDLFGEGSWGEFLMNYRDLRERLEKLRSFDPDRLISFADYLKRMEGQKNVLLFYQREYMPMLDRKKYIGLFEDGADLIVEQDFKDLFDLYKRDSKIDAKRIKRIFSDASISIHFLFMTGAPEHIGGLSDAAMEEHSEDIYQPFLEMAKATGGLAESSSNPAFMMKKAGDAFENYYLLYYKPTNTAADGKFREIKITVKNRGYRVLHRAGYFAK
jgi:VWFA-related protein